MTKQTYVQNPHFMLKALNKGTQIMEILYQAPFRGRALLQGRCSENETPELFHFLSKLLMNRTKRNHAFYVTLSSSCHRTLRKARFFVPKQAISQTVHFPGETYRNFERQFSSSQWDLIYAKARKLFHDKKYVSVRAVIPPKMLPSLKQYYRKLIDEGFVPLSDVPTENRYVAHNERLARLLHKKLSGFVTQIVGEPIKPSYVYLGSYRSGAILKKHTDREQCEFSISLLLDYQPQTHNASPWPLYLETDNKRSVAIYQSPGDALVYKGRELPHFRNKLPRGHSSTSLFFHYVRKNYRGPLD